MEFRAGRTCGTQEGQEGNFWCRISVDGLNLCEVILLDLLVGGIDHLTHDLEA